jgi:ABC-2 type transport system permease protein
MNAGLGDNAFNTLSSSWLAVWSLGYREWLRFVRQRNRVIGAVGQPLLFWLFFGEGLGPTFRMPGGTSDMTFRQYFFPGTLALILLFTAIFTTISIIEDRREGFLQSVLVAPMPRWAMVLGKLLGGSAIALAQGVLFMALGLTLGIPFSVVGWLGAILLAALVALSLTGLGFVIAWRTDSVQGFHAIMSVFLFPLWLLSGAFFPPPDGWLGVVMCCNPLTYAVAGLRRLIYLGDTAAVEGLPSLAVCWGVTLAFAGVMLLASWRVAALRTSADML